MGLILQNVDVLIRPKYNHHEVPPSLLQQLPMIRSHLSP